MGELEKELLKNPLNVDIFCFKVRIDLDKVDITKINSIFNLNLNDSNLPEKDKYINYKDRLIQFQNPIFIIFYNEIFWFASLNNKSLNKIHESFTKFKKYITLFDIENLTDRDCINMIYPFILQQYANSKLSEDFSNEFYEKIAVIINLFKEGFKNKLNFYFSYYIMSSIVEELLVRIATKEKIPLNKGFSIGRHISTLKGKSYITLNNLNKTEEKGGKKYLQILTEGSNTKNVFIIDKDKEEGNRIVRLLDEFEQIRTKYVHYTQQEPNNPSDCLIGTINLGQFLIWCEEHGYL